MKRSSILVQLVAIALAVLLPVEAAHCAWMMSPTACGAAGMRADHACCRAAASTPAASGVPLRPVPTCACLQLPQAVTHSATFAPGSPHSVQAILVGAIRVAPAAGSLATPIPRKATPPRMASVTAHPLRGPPAYS